MSVTPLPGQSHLPLQDCRPRTPRFRAVIEVFKAHDVGTFSTMAATTPWTRPKSAALAATGGWTWWDRVPKTIDNDVGDTAFQ